MTIVRFIALISRYTWIQPSSFVMHERLSAWPRTSCQSQSLPIPLNPVLAVIYAGPVRPEAVSSDVALYLPTFSHCLIVNKTFFQNFSLFLSLPPSPSQRTSLHLAEGLLG